MNNGFFATILGFLFFFFSSCQGSDITGKLHGKWQLKTVETSGTIINVDTVWYNFQSESLFMYQIYWAEKDTFMHWYGFRIQEDENRIQLELTYNPSIPLSDFLPYTDWEEEKRVFMIEQLRGKKLKLRSEEKVYSFQKFE